MPSPDPAPTRPPASGPAPSLGPGPWALAPDPHGIGPQSSKDLAPPHPTPAPPSLDSALSLWLWPRPFSEAQVAELGTTETAETPSCPEGPEVCVTARARAPRPVSGVVAHLEPPAVLGDGESDRRRRRRL